MRFRLFPLLVILSAASAFGQSGVGSILIGDESGATRMSSYSGVLATEIVEYKDGEDGTTHTRPGNHKPGKITVVKDWSNTSEWYSKLLSDAVSGGMMGRKSGSIVYLDRSGNEMSRQSFAAFGDTDVTFPGTGSLSNYSFGGIGLTFTSYLHSDGIIHRDLAVRNTLRARDFNVNVSEPGSTRAMNVFGTSPIAVHVKTGDLNGDGLPDFVREIGADHLQMALSTTEGDFVRKWDSDTDAAGSKGVPMTRHFTFAWTCQDGTISAVDFDATLISVFFGRFQIEVDCAVEAVKFSRDVLKGTNNGAG